MQLVTGISIATLAVAVAALALVLWLVVTEPWEPDAQAATPDVQSANEEHTRELDAEMVEWLIHAHAYQLLESKGLKNKTLSEEGDDFEILGELPGYQCFWEVTYSARAEALTGRPTVEGSYDMELNYNYIEKDDIWVVTSVRSACKNNY